MKRYITDGINLRIERSRRKDYQIFKPNNKREEIINLSNSKFLNSNPETIAKAQLGFDCWLEQLEEGWQEQHIEKCYNMMNNNINKIMDIVKITIYFFGRRN